MELTDYQKKVLRSFDPKKPVFFQKEVIDCEHCGDVRSCESEVRAYITPLGGEVVASWWDGRDCGEAYVECKVPYSALERVFKDRFFRYDPWQ